MPFPTVRPRRLRATPALRRLVAETALAPGDLIWPLFFSATIDSPAPVSTMPGVSQLPARAAAQAARDAASHGLGAVLLFGLPRTKDARGSSALDADGPVPRAVREMKNAVPELVVMTDVCVDEYTDHGHCGLLRTRKDGQIEVDNDATLEVLAEMALVHARAGADVVAPSDMMDGRVRAIREELDRLGHTETPIMSYAAKFASAYYGPFREAAESAPKFGDRRSYQMDAANALEALREVVLDIQEGADIVMVKPALAYLDIIHRVKTQFGYPTAAYAVSAEHAMIKAAAAQGWIDERAVTLESLLAMRRAGADILITYAAVDVARWLK